MCQIPCNSLIAIASKRVWIARVNDPDVMIREAAVELRILDLGHVARDAMFGAHRASGKLSGLGATRAVDG